MTYNLTAILNATNASEIVKKFGYDATAYNIDFGIYIIICAVIFVAAYLFFKKKIWGERKI